MVNERLHKLAREDDDLVVARASDDDEFDYGGWRAIIMYIYRVWGERWKENAT